MNYLVNFQPLQLLFSGQFSSGVNMPECQILAAARLFDGINFPQDNMAVLIEGDKIKRIGTLTELSWSCANQINLGGATILPGFIESHAHITFQSVNKNAVLEHGVTTVQDTGGPLQAKETLNKS